MASSRRPGVLRLVVYENGPALPAAHASDHALPAAIVHAKGDMQALQAAAQQALADARAGTVAHMATHTTNVKGSEEQQRAQAGAQMQAVFTAAQKSVDGLLQPLSGDAVARWEAGVAQLSTDFETSLADVKKKIDERHSGVGGWLTEHTVDAAFGLPAWVTEDYDAAEKKFGDGATSLLTDISRDVNQVIESCKKLIDQARKDIEAIVNSLPASLQSWAHGEADKLGKQLDQLSTKVDQTQKGLNKDLINRADGAVQTVRERVADLREQAKGLIGKIADAIAEFIKDPGKAIINGLLRLLAIPPASFWALVDKLGNVISGIAAEPMKFANTLMAGVGKGFQQFFDHLPINLAKSVFQWLFSKMGDVGVQMPLDFTIPSILPLVLEVMGITWPRIKVILAKHVGAENVEILDQAHQIISTLIMRGPLGVYHLIQEHLNPSMIVDAIKDAAISYVMEAIITRVAARIIMMLNPAGAILQAIEAIYRVIKWVIDNAARIFSLIEAVVNGAAQILAGNVSGVANLVERALGLLIIPVIDFLADYLGLGGIPNAIKKVIMGLQSKVEQILDKVIGFVVDKAKALWAAMKGKGKGKDDKSADGQPDDAKSDDVKKKAAAQLASRLSGEVPRDPATIKAALVGVQGSLAPEGLKKLEVQHVEHQPGAFEVFATASPRTRAHKFLVSDLEIGFPRTALLAKLNNVSLGRYINRTTRKGKADSAPEHAEHVLVDDLNARWSTISADCHVTRNVAAPFEITLTRSPCDMDGHTCGSLLQTFIDAKRADGYQLNLNLRMLSLHQRSTDAKKVLAGLRSHGATLSAVSVEQLLSEGLVTEDGPTIINNEKVVAKDGVTTRPLAGSVAELQAVLDEIEREGKTGS